MACMEQRGTSRPERELNYKQAHTHRIYLLISLSPLNTCVDCWTTGRMYTHITGLGEVSHTVLFTSRFLSDFSSERIFHRRCPAVLSIIVHSGYSHRHHLPPVRQRRIILFRFHRSSMATAHSPRDASGE
ncbi:Uncharacterized protein FWK35_00008783 [Aphis craccivora]|uniref:Uncharacterized protein n=1 Tax=Aphis craccivora TaxID=307492 RepID=A0A6G0ZFX8_APHCR|nr:Uncharacterized protein FWK35_00008783 [Aphis craccivora]